MSCVRAKTGCVIVHRHHGVSPTKYKIKGSDPKMKNGHETKLGASGELGATKLRYVFLYPFLHLDGRFETLAVVVNFSRFWAGKFHRHAKIGCVTVHHCHAVSPTERNKKIQKGVRWGPNTKNGSEMIIRPGDETLGGKQNFSPYGT
jgi:hypothetical protein